MAIPVNGKLKPRNDADFALLDAEYVEYNGEKLSDVLYEYLYVTNIRYGGLPVRKVYLGETLIWQCDKMTGYSESTSYTQGGVYRTIAFDLSGEAQSVFDDNAEARVLDVTFMIGKEDSTSFTNSSAHLGRMLRLQSGEHYTVFANSPGRLDKVVCMNTDTNSEVYSNSIGYTFDTHQMASTTEVKRNESAFSHIGNAIKSTSTTDIKHSTSSAVSCSERIYINGHFVVDFDVNQSGATVADAITAESNTSSKFVVTAIGSSSSPISTQALSESTSYTNSVLFVIEAIHPMGTSAEQVASDAIGRVFKASIMMSDNNVHMTDGDSMASTKRAIRSSSEIEHESSAKSFIDKYAVVVTDGKSISNSRSDNFIHQYIGIGGAGDADTNSNGCLSPVLWYVPIGDGMPLAENDDGVDITVNGNTLEIQQAYEIKIVDDKKGILEVS